MTDLLAWLNPYRWILLIALVLAVVFGVPIIKARYDAGQQKVGYDKRAGEDKAAMDAQTARNVDLQRASEKKYVVQAEVRDHYIVTTVTEIRDATTALASCPVGAGAVRLLNDAADCARGDSPTACGAGEPVPDTASTHGGIDSPGPR